MNYNKEIDGGPPPNILSKIWVNLIKNVEDNIVFLNQKELNSDNFSNVSYKPEETARKI